MSTLEGRAFLTHAADRRRLLWAGGTVFDVIIGGAQSGGVVSLLDQWGRRGDVTPLHIHNSEAEIFYVLEGGITAWVGRATRHPDRRAASGKCRSRERGPASAHPSAHAALAARGAARSRIPCGRARLGRHPVRR
jgi:hypothetical protein